jgi:hypothetical protein
MQLNGKWLNKKGLDGELLINEWLAVTEVRLTPHEEKAIVSI